MLSKGKIQYLKSLQLKKFREKSQEFIVEGPKLVAELLKSDFVVKSIFATSEWLKQNMDIANGKIEIFEVSQSELNRISGFKTPNQLVALAEAKETNLILDDVLNDFSIVLDGISDPGNLGTIIRTADWYGFRKIICSNDTVEFLNPKIVQSSMGSIFRVPVYYANIVDLIEKLRPDFPIYGTFMDGKNIYNESFNESGMLILGSESHGISKNVEKLVKIRLHIPSVETKAESLNVSVAGAICCSEIKRSKLKNS